MATSTKMKGISEEPKCSICEQSCFKVERVSPDIIRLVCENCGESYLIITNSEKAVHLEFVGPEKDRVATF